VHSSKWFSLSTVFAGENSYLCALAFTAAAVRLATKRAQSNEGAERLRRLEADYEWVAREKANFGRGEYDFEKVDVAEVYRWAGSVAIGFWRC
jgi:hypothetical protein